MMQDTIEVADFLNDKEFGILKMFTEKLISKNPLSSKNGTIGFPYQKSMVQKMLDHKLEKILLPYTVHRCMILNEVSPWAVHTDWHKNDKKPYCALLLPIHFNDKDVHTIVFNEKGYDDNWKGHQKEKNKKLTQRELELMSHINPATLDLVTVKKIMRWEQKKLIVWDRALLHCSDNFILKTKSKTALVLFLSKK